MIYLSPLQMIFLGLALLVLGVVLPFAMVLHFLESTLWLDFIAYFASLAGLLIGFLGLVLFARSRSRE